MSVFSVTPRGGAYTSRGAWDARTVFYQDDFAIWQGTMYQSLLPFNKGNQPDTNAWAWAPPAQPASAVNLPPGTPNGQIPVSNGSGGYTWQAQGLVGSPVPWLTDTIPTGYIEFAGQTITSAQYPQLFALFGGTLPNLRGTFLYGGATARQAGGTTQETLVIAQIPSHQHSVDDQAPGGGRITAIGTSQGANAMGVQSGASPGWLVPLGADVRAASWGGAQGGGGAHNNLPPYITCHWITVAG